MIYPQVRDIRHHLKFLYGERRYSRPTMIEIRGASFIADEAWILRPPNQDYIKRELQWYNSQSRNINDIPGGPPAIWKQVATPDGHVNSNYGYLFFGYENGDQFDRVVDELLANPSSRRATAIYTRPSMHDDSTAGGMQDFVCTNTVQFAINEANELELVVQMRSNDAVFGYNNDYAWQRYCQECVAGELGSECGRIIWQAASLHVYPRHFDLLA